MWKSFYVNTLMLDSTALQRRSLAEEILQAWQIFWNRISQPHLRPILLLPASPRLNSEFAPCFKKSYYQRNSMRLSLPQSTKSELTSVFSLPHAFGFFVDMNAQLPKMFYYDAGVERLNVRSFIASTMDSFGPFLAHWTQRRNVCFT